MDRGVIENKLESLRRCVVRIESKTPVSGAMLKDDLDLQDIIVLNLERAIQCCVDIAVHILSDANDAVVPASMSEAFTCLAERHIIDDACAHRLTKAVGFRNTAVHAYQKLDFDIIYSIITKHISDFRTFASQILAVLPRE